MKRPCRHQPRGHFVSINALDKTTQLSAGGGRDSTAPTKPTKSTNRSAGSEGGRLCGLSAGGTLSTGATSACISFCCSPSTVEELQRGRRATRGLKSIGVRRSRLLLCCVFYIWPLAGRRQTLSSSPRLRTESNSSGERRRQDGSLSTEHTECH